MNDTIDIIRGYQEIISSGVTPIELVSHVQEFYEKAFNKLLYLISGLGGLMLFALPYFINRQQKALFKSELDALKTSLDEMKSSFEEDMKSMSKAAKNDILVSSANIYHGIADQFNDGSRKKHVFYLSIAIQYYLTAEKFLYADNVLDELLNKEFDKSFEVAKNDLLELQVAIKGNEGYYNTSLTARRFISEMKNLVTD